MSKKRDKSDRYYSCQCIRAIVGKIRNDMITTGLASRLIKLLSETFMINEKEMSKYIADFYWRSVCFVGPDSFKGLLQYISKRHISLVEKKSEMWTMAASIITTFEEGGWGPKEFEMMYKAGIKHVQNEKGKG